MALKAAFIFVAPEAEASKHRTQVKTPQVELTVVGVADYAAAVAAAQELKKQGIGAIELCGGFGSEGVALVQKAVGPEIAVGVVRFDKHPGLGHRSGDELF